MTTRVIQRTVALDQGAQLGQVRPASLTPFVLYSPPDGEQAEVDWISMANTSASVVTVQVFHDPLGATFNATTCIWTGDVQANTTQDVDRLIYLPNTDDTLVVSVSVADTVTITAYGRETQERAR